MPNRSYHRKPLEKKPRWYFHSYHSLHIVLLFFFALTFGLFTFVSASLHRQTIQQHAAPPKTIRSLFVLAPKSSMHHPLHIHRINVGISAAVNMQGLGYTPQQIHTAYNIPFHNPANGTIAIVDAYSAPSLQSDLNAFDTAFNLPACTTANGCLTIQTQTSTPPPNPPNGTNWDIETTIDIEWAHATAPNAKILLFQANSDHPQDLLSGVDFARTQTAVSVISMSWVTPEFSTESQLDSLFTATHPVAFFAASGDLGTGGYWPAASPHVIGVGGTTLLLNSTNTVISETAWSGSGGGQSKYELEPPYQSTYNIPNANGKRAIPDVGLNADPDLSPFIIIVHGSAGSVGGTSVGTPIWAAMSVLGSQPITSDMLYQNAKLNYASYFRDITQGTNGTCGTICTARQGYDFITGLGSPLALPQSTGLISPTSTPTLTLTPSPTFHPTSTVTPTPSVTISPAPTGTLCHSFNAQDTIFQVTIGLHGIGKAGDNVKPNTDGNLTPIHQSRNVTVTVLDSTNQGILTVSGCINYNTTDGLFHGNIDMGNLANGSYLVTIKTDGYLEIQAAGIVQVQSQFTTIPPVSETTGDINNDNQIDLSDYNMLISCFGSKQNTASCLSPISAQASGADINDDGVIDGVDYNLFIRELSVQRGG